MPVLDGLQDAVARLRSGTLFDDVPAPQYEVDLLDLDVREELDSSDNPAVFVVLTLSDPPAGNDAWPVEEIWQLRRLLQAAVDEIQPDMTKPWYVRFVTRSAATSDDEDPQD